MDTYFDDRNLCLIYPRHVSVSQGPNRATAAPKLQKGRLAVLCLLLFIIYGVALYDPQNNLVFGV